MPLGRYGILLLMGWGWVGCPASPKGEDLAREDGEVLDGDPGEPGEDSRLPLEVPEGSRIAFGYQQYASEARRDLCLAVAGAAEPRSLNEELASLQLDCNTGCLLDRSGTWLAVLIPDGESSSSGHTVRLFRLDAGPGVSPSGIPEVRDAWYPVFGRDADGPALYWSRNRPACDATTGLPKGCRTFHRRSLRPEAPEEFLFSFPPSSILDRTLPHSGFFRLGEDGRTVIVLAPTVGSQRIFLWREAGEPVLQGGPFCASPSRTPEGACIESGGAFTDRDPVALSPDGNHLVAALVRDDRRLVIWHRDLRGDDPREATLMEVPEGSHFATDACYNRTPPTLWEPTRVVPPLRFSPDGTEVVLVGHAPCGSNRDKPWSKVLALSLERLDQGGRLRATDLRWITDFPPGDIAASVSILPEALDLSPSGDLVWMVGTPWLNSDGQPISDEQLQHRSDAEVLVTRRDGRYEVRQWTFRQGWRATSVQALQPTP